VPEEIVDMENRRAAGVALSHPRSRYLGLAAFAIILLLGSISLPYLAGASDFRGGFSVNTSSSTIVDGNMYVASFRSRIDSTVQGDLALASFSSSVYGQVGGSVHVLGGRTTIHGDVSGSVYIAGGYVEVHGRVDGDLVVAAGRVRLASGSQVGGDVVLAAGQAQSDGQIRGTVYGSTLVFGQEGRIAGSLEIQSNRLSVERDATISGDLRYQSPTGADIATGATIVGETVRTNSTPWAGIGDGALAPFGLLLKLVWSLVLAAALIAVAPRAMYRLAEMAAPVVQPGIAGLIGLVSIPVFAVLAMVTILGIPVGVMMLLAYGAGLYLSQIIVGLAIGRAILPRRWRDGSRGYMLLASTIGIILIGALRLAPVPYLNMGVVLVVTLLGFGAFISILLDLTSEQLRISRRRFT
jgi:cytoskeletal protein CcmA (bactofilin family)